LRLGRQIDFAGRGRPVLRSIRSRLLALVVATVVQFSILIGGASGVSGEANAGQRFACITTLDGLGTLIFGKLSFYRT
jgi:hypothetical protein